MSSGGWLRLHRIADALDRRVGTTIRGVPLLEPSWTRLLDSLVGRQSDRACMRGAVLPALVKASVHRIMHVGVRGYTRRYGAFFRGTGTEYWTCDIDPAAAVYGAPGRHVTEDVRRLDAAFRPGFFDVVMLNGVFGWGVDEPHDMERTLEAIANVLVPGGILLIGWNHDRSPDPDTLSNIALFEPVEFSGLPHRKSFPDVTHVYAWYRRRP